METKSEHTPGPWRIGYGGMEGDDFAIIISPHSSHAICNLEPAFYSLANAKLIAAAPDLLNGCLAALTYLADPPSKFKDNREEATKIIRAAIAKAKGEPIDGK